jgi:ribosomal protein S27AE
MPIKQEPKVANRISCPACGNDRDFFEIADDVVITTHYVQNPDGSFTLEENTSQPFGSIRLYCGRCEEDLTMFHQRFQEMIF